MTKYTNEKKERALIQMSAPHNKPVAEVSQLTGVQEPTLYMWRKQACDQDRAVPGDGQNPEQWSSAGKFAVVLEAAQLNEAELAAYYRRNFQSLYYRHDELASRYCHALRYRGSLSAEPVAQARLLRSKLQGREEGPRSYLQILKLNIGTACHSPMESAGQRSAQITLQGRTASFARQCGPASPFNGLAVSELQCARAEQIQSLPGQYRIIQIHAVPHRGL